jgi:hypothetical protein
VSEPTKFGIGLAVEANMLAEARSGEGAELKRWLWDAMRTAMHAMDARGISEFVTPDGQEPGIVATVKIEWVGCPTKPERLRE